MNVEYLNVSYLLRILTSTYMVCSGSRTQTLECWIENHWFRILTFALWDLGWTSRKKNTCALLASAARGHWELKNDCKHDKEGDCSNFLAWEKAIFFIFEEQSYNLRIGLSCKIILPPKNAPGALWNRKFTSRVLSFSAYYRLFAVCEPCLMNIQHTYSLSLLLDHCTNWT